ncbi:ABC-type multidrug transport system, ATPase component [Polaromonas sp. CF318]|uniref:ABC transporter ATP-binding protein n=1 Tax=Polaromonas sp. CF318 TaxID=1144318 RepID=UPI0002713C9D|nr:ABC transporter ATP-binding protein [Polaromonas sp. CF318]EJL89669.1 ABC-type multidrug transport system, ATPase component [Polaromonas sp. CF318]
MSDSPQPALQAGEVHKNYGASKGRAALAGVSLEVHPGECLALLGMNGAGKTTLIKCLLDLAAPTSGTLSIFGQDHSRPLSREQLAYVPERFSPPGWLHARDYFRLAARLHGLPFPQLGLPGMLTELDLEQSILDRPIRECSKGMAQKIGLAAAFLARRRLLVLDEPMSGLDPLSRIRVREQLRLQRDTGCAVLMSTHSLADVQDLADRVAILHAGSLRFIGPVDEWLARYDASSMEEAYLAVVDAAKLTN